MKYTLILSAICWMMSGCNRNSADRDVCNMLYYADDSNMVEVFEVEPELVFLPVDTANLRGRWKLTKYHSPFFTIEPTDSFAYILTISGKGLGIKFCDNELMSGYTLNGDTINLRNGVITEIKGQDEPIEIAIKGLLFNSNVKRVSITKHHEPYLTVFGKEGEYADFMKLDE